MEIWLYLVIFGAGIFVGFLLRSWVVWRKRYSGVMHVTKSQGKTMYTLELADYPDTIEFKREIVLRVDTSEENLNRE